MAYYEPVPEIKLQRFHAALVFFLQDANFWLMEVKFCHRSRSGSFIFLATKITSFVDISH